MSTVAFTRTLDDFAQGRVVGSHRMAREAVSALKDVTIHGFNTFHHLSDFAREVKKRKDQLLEVAKHDILTINCLNILFGDREITRFTTMKKLYDHMRKRHAYIESHLDQVTSDLPQLGAEKIKDGTVVFCFGHSVEAQNIILHAQVQSKKFTVVNTEHRPSMQGRIFAEELAKLNVPVVHYVDAAMRQAIRKADLILIGCDAIDYSHKIFGEIGSELLCEAAAKKQVPVYVCSDSWKYDAQNLAKTMVQTVVDDPSEIWPKAPKGVTLHNYAFEKIDPKLITGIITEFGIVKPSEFTLKIKQQYDVF